MRPLQTFGLHQHRIRVGIRRWDEWREGLQGVVGGDGHVPQDERGGGPLEGAAAHRSHAAPLLHQGAGEDNVHVDVTFGKNRINYFFTITVVTVYCTFILPV